MTDNIYKGEITINTLDVSKLGDRKESGMDLGISCKHLTRHNR